MGSRTGVLLRDMSVCVCGGSDYLPRLPFSHLPPPLHRLILYSQRKEWYKGKTRTRGGDRVSPGSLQERHIQLPFMKYCSSSY